jgi:hypothetical protein
MTDPSRANDGFHRMPDGGRLGRYPHRLETKVAFLWTNAENGTLCMDKDLKDPSARRARHWTVDAVLSNGRAV